MPADVRGPQGFETAIDAAPATVAEFAPPKSPVQRFQTLLHQTPWIVPLLVLLAAVVVFGAILGGRFFSAYALTLILQQVAITGIVGTAQSLVVLTAGIDLSVGAIMVLSSVVMGQFTFRYGIPAPVSVLAGLAVGAAIGAVNGFLVARVRLPPFIVTLGMWQIVLAANFLYSANETIRAQDIETQAPILQFFGHTVRVGGAVLTYGGIVMVLLVIVFAYVLNQTAWGRHVYCRGR